MVRVPLVGLAFLPTLTLAASFARFLATADAVCSCDCCAVQPRLPDEQVEVDGMVLTHKCATGGGPSETSTCPHQCAPSPADATVTALTGSSVDYARFCLYTCRPSENAAGAACVRLVAEETQDLRTADETGNGVDSAKPVVVDTGDGTGDGAGVGDAAAAMDAADEAAAVQEQQAQQAQQAIRVDVAAARESRFKAEEEAAKARGQSAIASAKAMESRAKLRAAQSSLALTALNPAEVKAAAERSLLQAESEEQAAAGDLEEAQKVLAETQAQAVMAAKEARDLTVAGIKSRGQAAAERLAKATETLRGWDKPPEYPRWRAAQAANMYQGAAAMASQRVTEYQQKSIKEMQEADAVRESIIAVANQRNAAQAHGAKDVAARLNAEVSGMLSQATALEAAAKADDATARKTQESIPKWNDAAQKASTYSIWQYSQMVTEPPALPPGFVIR